MGVGGWGQDMVKERERKDKMRERVMEQLLCVTILEASVFPSLSHTYNYLKCVLRKGAIHLKNVKTAEDLDLALMEQGRQFGSLSHYSIFH